MINRSAGERFENKYFIESNTGCWIWIGSIGDRGYGLFWDNGTRRASRWAYEYYVNPIPSGLVLDHLCRVHGCVNPEHLEPVTDAINIHRGIGIAPRRAAQTHCIYGHELISGNIYRRGKCRQCKICHRLRRNVARDRRRQRDRLGIEVVIVKS